MSVVVATGTRMESVALLASLPGPVQEILRPLVDPLLDLWDQLVGDDEAVHESAARWHALAAHLDDLAHTQSRTIEDTEVAWLGLAQRAFADAATEVASELGQLARRTVDVGACLEEAAIAVRRTEELVLELIRELLEWAAVSLAVSAATSLVTLGASAVAGAAAASARAAVVTSRIATLVRQLAAVLRHIEGRIKDYRAWVERRSRMTQVVLAKLEGKAKSELGQQSTGLDPQVGHPAKGLLDTVTSMPRTPSGSR